MPKNKKPAKKTKKQNENEEIKTELSPKQLELIDIQTRAAANEAAAQHRLGIFYDNGYQDENGKILIERNVAKAIALYKKAAAQGYADAQFDLAIWYEYGVEDHPSAFDKNGKPCIVKNIEQSLNLYKLAAAQNQLGAIYNLAELHLTGIPDATGKKIIDKNEAKRLFELALSAGDKTAPFKLVKIYVEQEHLNLERAYECVKIFKERNSANGEILFLQIEIFSLKIHEIWNKEYQKNIKLLGAKLQNSASITQEIIDLNTKCRNYLNKYPASMNANDKKILVDFNRRKKSFEEEKKELVKVEIVSTANLDEIKDVAIHLPEIKSDQPVIINTEISQKITAFQRFSAALLLGKIINPNEKIAQYFEIDGIINPNHNANNSQKFSIDENRKLLKTAIARLMARKEISWDIEKLGNYLIDWDQKFNQKLQKLAGLSPAEKSQAITNLIENDELLKSIKRNIEKPITFTDSQNSLIDDLFSKISQEKTPKVKINNFTLELQKIAESAESGNIDDQIDLAKRYYEGNEVEQNFLLSANYFELASANNGAAQFNLGLMYLGGIGVKQDIAKGNKLLRSAKANKYFLSQPEEKILLEILNKKEEIEITRFLGSVNLSNNLILLEQTIENRSKINAEQFTGINNLKYQVFFKLQDQIIELLYSVVSRYSFMDDDAKGRFEKIQKILYPELNPSSSLPQKTPDIKEETKTVEIKTSEIQPQKIHKYSPELEEKFLKAIFSIKLKGGNPDPKQLDNLVKKFAELGHPLAQYSLASDIITSNPVEAARLYALSENEIAASRSNLGVMKYYGKGIEKNQDEGLKLLLSAAEDGNSNAQYNLGLIYDKLGKKEEAEKLYREAADQCHPDARYKLANMYDKISAKQKEGVSYLHKAAKQQFLNASYLYGMLFSRGEVVEKNFYKSYKYLKSPFSKETLKLNPEAFELLKSDWNKELEYSKAEWKKEFDAELKENFQLFQNPKFNEKEIRKLFKQSQNYIEEFAKLNDPKTLETLKTIKTFFPNAESKDSAKIKKPKKEESFSNQIKQNLNLGIYYFEREIYKEAAEFLKLPADENEPQAQYLLATILYKDWQKEPNLKEALEYFSSAEKLGHIDARISLATAYIENDKIRDLKKADNLLINADWERNPKAAYQLGLLYLRPDFANQNFEKSLHFFETSLDLEKETNKRNEIQKQITEIKKITEEIKSFKKRISNLENQIGNVQELNISKLQEINKLYAQCADFANKNKVKLTEEETKIIKQAQEFISENKAKSINFFSTVETRLGTSLIADEDKPNYKSLKNVFKLLFLENNADLAKWTTDLTTRFQASAPNLPETKNVEEFLEKDELVKSARENFTSQKNYENSNEKYFFPKIEEKSGNSNPVKVKSTVDLFIDAIFYDVRNDLRNDDKKDNKALLAYKKLQKLLKKEIEKEKNEPRETNPEILLLKNNFRETVYKNTLNFYQKNFPEKVEKYEKSIRRNRRSVWNNLGLVYFSKALASEDETAKKENLDEAKKYFSLSASFNYKNAQKNLDAIEQAENPNSLAILGELIKTKEEIAEFEKEKKALENLKKRVDDHEDDIEFKEISPIDSPLESPNNSPQESPDFSEESETLLQTSETSSQSSEENKGEQKTPQIYSASISSIKPAASKILPTISKTNKFTFRFTRKDISADPIANRYLQYRFSPQEMEKDAYILFQLGVMYSKGAYMISNPEIEKNCLALSEKLFHTGIPAFSENLFILSLQYKNGGYLNKNIPMAVQCYVIAASLGHEKAKYNLAQYALAGNPYAHYALYNINYANSENKEHSPQLVNPQLKKAGFQTRKNNDRQVNKWKKEAEQKHQEPIYSKEDNHMQRDIAVYHRAGLIALSEANWQMNQINLEKAQAKFDQKYGDFAKANQKYRNAHAKLKFAEQNYLKAKQNFLKAAESGYSSSQLELGIMYYKGQIKADSHAQDPYANSKEAAKWFELAALNGVTEGQYRLAVMHLEGSLDGTPNFAKAAQYFTLAAQQGNAAAQFKLGLMHCCGIGVAQDFSKAAEYFTSPTQRNFPESLFCSTLMNFGGIGMKQDIQAGRDQLELLEKSGGAINTSQKIALLKISAQKQNALQQLPMNSYESFSNRLQTLTTIIDEFENIANPQPIAGSISNGIDALKEKIFSGLYHQAITNLYKETILELGKNVVTYNFYMTPEDKLIKDRIVEKCCEITQEAKAQPSSSTSVSEFSRVSVNEIKR